MDKQVPGVDLAALLDFDHASSERVFEGMLALLLVKYVARDGGGAIGAAVGDADDLAAHVPRREFGEKALREERLEHGRNCRLFVPGNNSDCNWSHRVHGIHRAFNGVPEVVGELLNGGRE